MRHAVAVALLAVVAVTPSWARFSLPATDTFTSTPGCNLGDGTCPNWTVSAGGASAWTIPVLGTSVAPNSAGGSHDVVFWNADSFTSDQKSSVTVIIGGGGFGYVGPAVRADASGNSYGFLCGTGTVYKQTAGSPATLQSGLSVCANGDVVRLEATGTTTTTLRVFLNNVQNGSDVVDSSSAFASGAAGLYGYQSATDGIDTWTGDNIGGGGPTFPSAIIKNNPILCCAITVRR